MGKRSMYLCGVAALTAVTAPAHAQDQAAQPTEDPPGLVSPDEIFSDDEIIVTAQRREERVQDIPVAISAFGAEQIERTGIVSLENIAPRVPSFYFGSFGPSRPQLYIRGIGTRSFDPGSESSVGVFVDDVYLGRATGSFGSLRDIERIEVLRGPQGTLYGRNTIGGAINVISREPTPEFEGQVEAGYSNYDGYEISGGVGGPITSNDSIMFRAAGWRSYRDGYQVNLTTGNSFQGIDNWGGRLRLAFVPTDRLRIDLTAEYGRDDDEAAFAGFNRGSGPTATAEANPRAVFLGRPPVPPFNGPLPIVYTGGNEGFLNIDPTLYRETQTYIGRIEYDADVATLTSISSFRTLDNDETRDLEGSSIDALNQASFEVSDQYTQEFRITSNPGGSLSFDGVLDWIIGGFYYRDRSTRRDEFRFGNDSIIAFLGGGPQVSVSSSDYEIDSYAVFGQATVHFTDRFEVTLGGRYTRDEKRAIQTGTNTRPGIPLVVVPFQVDNSATYTSFDPRIVASYQITPDINVYASYSTGFKSGGFQFVPFSAAQANVLFNPEGLTAYEAGFKTEFLDRTLRLNVAAYYYDYTDLQVSRIVDLGGGAAVSLISNAASSTIFGVDVEILARPSDNVDVSVAYGYLDATYDQYTTNLEGTPVLPSQDFNGTRLVRAPEHSINVGAEWRIPFGDDNRFTLRADYALLSDFFHEPGQGERRFGGAVSLSEEDGYGLLDLRASVDIRNIRVTGYVTNVFDTDYRRTVIALGSTLSDFPGIPRIYGVRVGYRF